MQRIKKHKYLLFLIVFNSIVLGWGKYIMSKISYFMFSGEINLADDWLIKYIFLWVLLLPLDSLYIARRIYSVKKKWLNISSSILILLTFIFFIDPGFMSIPWVPSWLLKYDFIQNMTNIIPWFIFILWVGYIIWWDLLLRYMGNKLYCHFKKQKN